jgi:hypothetical protein
LSLRHQAELRKGGAIPANRKNQMRLTSIPGVVIFCFGAGHLMNSASFELWFALARFFRMRADSFFLVSAYGCVRLSPAAPEMPTWCATGASGAQAVEAGTSL